MKNKGLTKFKYFIVLSGVLLTLATELKSNTPDIWYVLWAIFPYGCYYLAAWKAESQSPGALIGGGMLVLGVDVFVHIKIFFFPGSSTDSIALLTMPIWQCVVIMPVGFCLGWLVGKIVTK